MLLCMYLRTNIKASVSLLTKTEPGPIKTLWIIFSLVTFYSFKNEWKETTEKSMLLSRLVVFFIWIFTAPLNLKIQYVNLVLFSYLDFSFYVCVSSPLNKYWILSDFLRREETLLDVTKQFFHHQKSRLIIDTL